MKRQPLRNKAHIEKIMREMIKANPSEVNDTLYLHKRHEGKNLFIEGYPIIYLFVIDEDEIYLAPNILYDEITKDVE